MRTERLEIRRPEEADRERFVELFRTESFMVYSLSGELDAEGAHRRFDRMLAVADELAFCKQPVIEASTGTLVGYAGGDFIDWNGERRVEFGYRLVEAARGKGYATEASRALLESARESFTGQVLGLIDPANARSRNVLRKLGFQFVEQTHFEDGLPCDVYQITIDHRTHRPD